MITNVALSGRLLERNRKKKKKTKKTQVRARLSLPHDCFCQNLSLVFDGVLAVLSGSGVTLVVKNDCSHVHT